jgi:tRNA threonylcarbamoyladenosine biosynthesis protein TsaE
MNKYEILTNSAEETTAIAYKLGELIQANTVITLEGDLGAGKTTFTKGLAKGLGITKNVNSPTFTIIKEYKGRLPLYHMDVYRIEDEFEDLGFHEYFESEGVTVVEWAHLIQDQLPQELLGIQLFYQSENQRKIILTPLGEKYVELCKELM